MKDYQVVLEKKLRFAKVIYYACKPALDNLDEIEYGKLKPKERMYCDISDETYDPEINKNGFYIYELPENDVKAKLAHKSDRWRLFGADQRALNVQKENPNGSMTWQKHYPWTYEVVKVPNGVDKENGEQLFKKTIKWTQLKQADLKKKQ